MKQKLTNTLAVSFTCSGTEAVGDYVEIVSDNTVAKPTAAGSIKVVGTVDHIANGSTTCTVQTRFLRRHERTVSGAIGVGPFVIGADGKPVAYDAQNHSPAAIVGLVIKGAGSTGGTIETLEY